MKKTLKLMNKSDIWLIFYYNIKKYISSYKIDLLS